MTDSLNDRAARASLCKRLIKRANHMYKKGRGLMKQLYEDQVLLFEDQDLIAEEYAEIQERKMILGENGNY